MSKDSNQRVAKAAGIMMVAMLLSRVLGFVREQIMTAQFGKGYITDAYFAAFTIPDLLYNLLVGGALSAAFIPIFSAYIANKQEDEAWEFASTVTNLAIVLFVIGITFGIIFAPSLMPLIAYKLSPKAINLSVELTRIMFPAVLFTGLNGILMGVLNSYQSFLSPAIGSIIYNLGIIVMGVILGEYYGYGIKGFAIGVIVGVIGNFFVQLPNVIKKKPKYYLRINLKHPGVKKLGILVLPALLGLSISQINLIVNQNFASGLAEGSITAIRIANRLMLLPLGVFAFSIAMAVFPTLSAQFATGKLDEYKNTFSMGIRSSMFITLPAAVGLMSLSEPIIRLLFQMGKWTESATIDTAHVLFYYSIGLVAQAALLVITRGFYAMNDTKTPVYVGLVSVFLNFFVNWSLVNFMGAPGLALGFSIVSICNMLFLLILLKKKIGRIGAKKISISFLKALIAAVFMGLTSSWVALELASFINIHTKINQIIQVGIAVVIGAIVYVIISIVLKMEEMGTVMGIFKRKFGRKKAVTEG